MVNYTCDILTGRTCPWVPTVRKSIFTARQLAAEEIGKVHLQTTQGTDGGAIEKGPTLGYLGRPRSAKTSPPSPTHSSGLFWGTYIEGLPEYIPSKVLL